MSLAKTVQQFRLCTYSERYEKKSGVAVYLNGVHDQATERHRQLTALLALKLIHKDLLHVHHLAVSLTLQTDPTPHT